MRKRKIRKLVIFLLCSIMITIFEPFGDTSTYAGQVIAVKLQQLIIMEIYITCIRQYKNQGASCIL